jgi:hypothetical protein
MPEILPLLDSLPASSIVSDRRLGTGRSRRIWTTIINPTRQKKGYSAEPTRDSTGLVACNHHILPGLRCLTSTMIYRPAWDKQLFSDPAIKTSSATRSSSKLRRA